MGKRKGGASRKNLGKKRRDLSKLIADHVQRYQDIDIASVSLGSDYSSDRQDSGKEAMEEELDTASYVHSSHYADNRGGSSTQMNSPGVKEVVTSQDGGEADITDDEVAQEGGSSTGGFDHTDYCDSIDGEGEHSGWEEISASSRDNDVELLATEERERYQEQVCRHQQEQKLREKQRKRQCFMKKLVPGSYGLPPMLTCDGEHPMRMAVFCLPAFVPERESVKGSGRATARLDLNHWTLPGAAVVRASDDTAQYLWFCNCSAENIVIKRTAEALHSMAGGCSDVKSAECECVQYCQAILSKADVDVGTLIKHSPMHSYYDDDCAGRLPGEARIYYAMPVFQNAPIYHDLSCTVNVSTCTLNIQKIHPRWGQQQLWVWRGHVPPRYTGF